MLGFNDCHQEKVMLRNTQKRERGDVIRTCCISIAEIVIGSWSIFHALRFLWTRWRSAVFKLGFNFDCVLRTTNVKHLATVQHGDGETDSLIPLESLQIHIRILVVSPNAQLNLFTVRFMTGQQLASLCTMTEETVICQTCSDQGTRLPGFLGPPLVHTTESLHETTVQRYHDHQRIRIHVLAPTEYITTQTHHPKLIRILHRLSAAR